MNYKTVTKSELVREIKSLKSTLKEAERKRGEHELAEYVERFQRLTELSITLSGDPIDIFKSVAETIGKLFGIPIVCLSEIRGDMLFFLSVYNKGEVLIDAGQCPISITPCSTVKDSKDMRIYQNVMEMFPKASFLKMYNAFSYCGFPSLDSEGNVISVTCLLDDKPHEYSSEDKDLLQIFAQRIGIEMERKEYITEQKRVKGLLKESERKYHLLFETANDAIFLADVENGIIIDANKRAEYLLGIPVKEIVGMNHTQIYPPEDVGRNIKLFKKYAQIDKSITLEEIFVQHKDGRKILVEISSSVFELGGRKVVQGIFRDITERKKEEEEIRKLTHAVEQSSSTVVITDAKGNIEYVNPKFTRLTGYTAEEVMGLNPRILKTDKTPPEEYKRLWKTITSGSEWNGEFCNKKKNGELYWELASISPVKNKEGVITNFIAVKEDITERKRIEDALRQSKKQMQSILDNTTAVIYLKGIQGKYIFINRQYQNLFHITKEEIVGKTDYDIFPKEMADAFQANDRKVLEAQAPLEMEEVALHDDGPHTYISIKFPLFDSKGILYGVCGISTDITERKKAEETLQKQKKDLEQKNIALNEVLGQIELEKKQIKDNVVANAENLLLPIIQKLRLTGESRKYVQLLRKNLQELTSSFGTKLTERRAKLTSREIEICNMVRNGLTSKEIASLLNISSLTIEKHRINIRRKLGIINKDINLTSFLKTL